MQRNGSSSNASSSQLRGPQSGLSGATSPSLASKAAVASLQRLLTEVAAFFRGWDLRGIMRAHAFCAIALGGTTIALPHSYLGIGYSHYAHEFIRLYGCLTLAIGWIVWKSQAIKDGACLLCARSDHHSTLTAPAMTLRISLFVPPPLPLLTASPLHFRPLSLASLSRSALRSPCPGLLRNLLAR